MTIPRFESPFPTTENPMYRIQEGGEAPRLSAPAWALRLLLTGAGGLRTLREELR